MKTEDQPGPVRIEPADAFGLSFHHFGLAVDNPERASLFLKGLGYSLGPVVYDPEQNVRLNMAQHDRMPDVELIHRADSPGPLETILSGNDQLIYHLCFETLDRDASLAAIRAHQGRRAMCIAKPKPAILFGNRMVAFYLIAGFGLVELLSGDVG